MTTIDRRAFLSTVAGSVAAGAMPSNREQSRQSRKGPEVPATPTRLANPAFSPLPLGAIRPSGWLERQLRLQADGLSGNLDRFWPDVAESQWFGGKAEGWERAPYWLDGVIPLAWLLDDAPLKKRITGYVDYIVAHRRGDGWYGPYAVDGKPYDIWAILLANKALAQYHAATGDSHALTAVVTSLHAMFLETGRWRLDGWGRFRWYEGLISAFHAYEHTREPWLLKFAQGLRNGGIDFDALFATEDFALPTPRRGLWKWTKHVVNTAMAMKSPALSWRLDPRPAHRASALRMLETLDKHHGQVTGMFTGDECLAGKNPLQGTELCAVVEFMYSLENLFAVFGEPAFADRLERVAFNALPATLAPDMWSHQYDQQVNQVQCTINPEHGWTTNGPESNLFGLEPNYGCCTSNMHQGWPKFAAHLWMKTADGGLVAAAWAPCRVSTKLRDVPVRIVVDTDYPFRDVIRLTVTPDRRLRFPLLLRVPAWARGATVRAGADRERPMTSGSLHRLERDWDGSTEVTLRFPMQPVVTTRYNDAVAIERGPLVYSLQIGEQWTRVNADKPHRELPHGDFEVRPTTPWNYALVVHDRVEDALKFEERPVGARPFSPEGAGVVAQAYGHRLPNWKIVNGWAGELAPMDEFRSNPGRLTISSQPREDITLIPYGCTNIRITEFPRFWAME